MKGLILTPLILLGGCAETSRYTLGEQCVHQPGCVSTFNSAGGPSQAAAIAPQSAGHWEPVRWTLKAKKR